MEQLSDFIDSTDQAILSEMLKDAKVTYSEVAKNLNISVSTVHVRVKKLEEAGIIHNYTLNLDYTKIGLRLTAFIGFIIDSKKHKDITERLGKINEIIDLHHCTGKYHLFAKVICRDSTHLKEILLTKLNDIEGVEKTETMISLGSILSSPYNLLKSESSI